jgi:hypothetical protein
MYKETNGGRSEASKQTNKQANKGRKFKREKTQTNKEISKRTVGGAPEEGHGRCHRI